MVCALLALLAVGLYLHYSLKAGWYYDDWNLYSLVRDAGGGWSHELSACSQAINGGRSLACVYHVTEYDLFTSHRALYHLVVIVYLILIAWMAYAILKRCRLAWYWAALAAAFMLLSPVSDSARLWSVGAIGQAVIALQMFGVMLALWAFDASTQRRRLLLHAGAAFVSAAAMVTYEIAVPLVFLNILIYFAAKRNRAAVIRGAADMALVLLFVIYRVTIAPVSAASGYDVKRPLDAEITRAWTLLKTAWQTWHAAYAPGVIGVALVIAVLVAATAAAAFIPATRARLGFWAAIFAGALLVSALSALIYVTSNDLYLPQIFGTFNRLNLSGTLAYAVLFVALLGMGWEVVSAVMFPLQLTATGVVAPVLLVAAVVGSGLNQRSISDQHKGAWEASWQQQQTALRGYKVALRGVPRNSRILGFDTPEWEVGWVPIFASSWDLRGAIDYTTHVRPPMASPFAAQPNGAACGPSGVTVGGATLTPYRVSGSPLYAVSPAHEQAVRITSEQSCQQIVQKWAAAPYWGYTVTG